MGGGGELGRGGGVGLAPGVNFISPLIFSTLSLISRANADAAERVLAHQLFSFSFQKNSSAAVLFHSAAFHCCSQVAQLSVMHL